VEFWIAFALLELLQQWRDNPEEQFENVWTDAESLASILDTQIQTPRLAGRQRNRINIPMTTSDPKTYYKLAIYIPFIDYLLSELRNRFSFHCELASKLSVLVPAYLECYTFKDLQPTILHFSRWLPEHSTEVANAEYLIWRRMWVAAEKKPTNVVDALKACNKSFLPLIHQLLYIFAALPVSTAEAERSFSSLKHVKSERRSTMGENRLNGLIMLYAHKEATNTTEKISTMTNWVTDEFAKLFPRKMTLA
jgi:hypothetical protein